MTTTMVCITFTITLCLDLTVFVLGFLRSVMKHITALLLIASVNQSALSRSFNNGFSIKFKPNSLKEELKPKTFSSLFAKIPQEDNDDVEPDLISKAYVLQSPELSAGCTNQIAKILVPVNNPNENSSTQKANYIHLPVVQQAFKDYKIVVATAPSNIKIAGPNGQPVVVYIVFPEEEPSDSQSLNVPSVYFVTKRSFKNSRKQESVPVIIIDSNRTVTGLKSKEVAKFIKFKQQNRNILKHNDD